jgi:hypothetical protein
MKYCEDYQFRLFEKNTLKSFMWFFEFRNCRTILMNMLSGSGFAHFLNACKKCGGGWGGRSAP